MIDYATEVIPGEKAFGYKDLKEDEWFFEVHWKNDPNVPNAAIVVVTEAPLLLNTSINIFSQIALVILIGISTKNSILIVDYTNQLRLAGKNIESSVKEACELRFRPIIMTSLSTMIAMMPLVVGNIGPGAGEGSRLAVGATILGGMIISTFFTLYVTPTMYLALAKNTKRIDAVDIELKKQLR